MSISTFQSLTMAKSNVITCILSLILRTVCSTLTVSRRTTLPIHRNKLVNGFTKVKTPKPWHVSKAAFKDNQELLLVIRR